MKDTEEDKINESLLIGLLVGKMNNIFGDVLEGKPIEECSPIVLKTIVYFLASYLNHITDNEDELFEEYSFLFIF